MNHAEDRQSPGGSPSRFRQLLRRELRRARVEHWRAALPMALAASALILFLGLLLLRLWVPAQPAGGRMFAGILWLLLLLPFVALALWPLRRLPNVRLLLAEAERRADTRQLLEAAADVTEGRLANKGYSPALMDKILSQAAATAAAGLPRPPRSPWSRRAGVAAALLALIAVPLLLLPSRAGIRPGQFLLRPSLDSHYAEGARLAVIPGSVEILAGSPLRLEVREENLPWRFPGDLRLEIDETGDLFRPAALNRGDSAWFHARDAVYQSFSYRVSRGRSSSETFRVEVYHPPVLDSLRLRAVAPAYTGLAPREVDLRSGELTVPAGSRLSFLGFSSSDLQAAWLGLAAGDSLAAIADSLPLAVAGKRLEGELVAATDLRLSLGLVDERGTTTRTPVLLSLRALPDRSPQVEILAPGPDEDLNRDFLVHLDITAADDYGVASLELRAYLQGAPDTLTQAIPLDAGPAPRLAQRHLWDVAVFELFPGDVVEYWIEARDNRPGQPNRGRSRVQRLRVPSIAEIFESIEREDEGRQESLSDLLEEGRKMQEDLRELEQELRADPELDWEKQEELRDAFRKQEEMIEQLEDLSKSLNDRNEKMNENELMREDMAEKLERIQELYEELSETEAGELLRQFQEMIDEMDPETLPEELRELRMNQEQLLEQLERTEAMLEQILREQAMDNLLQQVDEMIERQEQLREETKDLAEAPEDAESENEAENKDEETEQGNEGEQEDSEGEEEDAGGENSAEDSESQSSESDQEMAERQDQLAEDSEQLNEKIRELAQELAEEFPDEAQNMEESTEPQSESNPSEPMRDAAEEMRESDPQAGESQQEAMQRLLKLYWRLVQAQEGMSGAMEQQSMEALDAVTRHALEMSLRQEDQQSEMQRLLRANQSAELQRRAARRQMNLYQSMERVREQLLEAARLTMGVSPKAMQSSRLALDEMESSVAELEKGRSAAGIQSAGSSVGHLNETVIELLHGMRMEGQGGGSCPNPTQSMQDMLQRQQQLNKDTRQQGQSMGDGMSMKQRAEMQRLKAEQQAIREGLEGMADSEDELLGRLDRILEDMADVERDLESGRIDAETLQRQEKIFEKLLDAQRSVHQQEYKQRRKSRSADELEPLWPDDAEIADPLEKLRDEIRRGLGEAAPPEYEALIQEYYRSLLDREANP